MRGAMLDAMLNGCSEQSTNERTNERNERNQDLTTNSSVSYQRNPVDNSISLADEWFAEFIRRCQTPIGRMKVLAETPTFEEVRARHLAEQKQESVTKAERVNRRFATTRDPKYPFNRYEVTAAEIVQWKTWLDEGMSHTQIGELAGLSAASVFRHVCEHTKREQNYEAARAAFSAKKGATYGETG